MFITVPCNAKLTLLVLKNISILERSKKGELVAVEKKDSIRNTYINKYWLYC